MMRRFTKKELKEIFDNQCQPCLKDYPYCLGDIEKAKKFKCSKFFCGYMELSSTKQYHKSRNTYK